MRCLSVSEMEGRAVRSEPRERRASEGSHVVIKNGGRTWGCGGLDSPRRSLDVRKKSLVVFNNVSNLPFREGEERRSESWHVCEECRCWPDAACKRGEFYEIVHSRAD